MTRTQPAYQETNSIASQRLHVLQFDRGVTIESRVPPANSNAVLLDGKSAPIATGIVVTSCLNNTLRHSRPAGRVADDWISPAFPAPASRPVIGIIGPAEESFGLRKSPTAPMLRVLALVADGLAVGPGWRRRTCLGQKSDARR